MAFCKIFIHLGVLSAGVLPVFETIRCVRGLNMVSNCTYAYAQVFWSSLEVLSWQSKSIHYILHLQTLLCRSSNVGRTKHQNLDHKDFKLCFPSFINLSLLVDLISQTLPHIFGYFFFSCFVLLKEYNVPSDSCILLGPVTHQSGEIN